MKPQPLYQDASGTTLSTVTEVGEAFAEIWRELEDGYFTTVNDLAERVAEDQLARAPYNARPKLEEIPSIHDLERSLRKAAKWKATNDSMPAEVAQTDVALFAKILMPLHVKIAVQIAEPIHFKGGEAYGLFKGKGSAATISSETYRSILVAGSTGKRIKSTYRPKLLPSTKDYFQPTQIGGLPNMSCDFLSHLAREFAAYAKNSGISSAFLFWDVKNAFYSVIRPLVAKAVDCRTTSALDRLIQVIGLTQEESQELQELLHNSSAIQQAGASQYMEQMIAEGLSGTWFRVKHADRTIATQQSTRPGDPMADLIYNFFMARLLRRIDSRIKEARIQCLVEWDGIVGIEKANTKDDKVYTSAVENGTWVDDTVFLILPNDCYDVDSAVAKLAAITFDTMLEFGLTSNLAKGKSEAVIRYRGYKAQEEKAKLFFDKQYRIEFLSAYRGSQHVHAVFDYKYLGSIVDADATMLPEITSRAAQGIDAVRPLSAKVFKNEDIPYSDKAALASMYALTRNLYNAHVWPPLGVRESQVFNNGVFKVFRIAANMQNHHSNDKHHNNTEVLASLNVLEPGELLAVARLKYVKRMVVYAPQQLWALIRANANHKGSWLALLHSDLTWLVDNLPAGKHPPADDLEAWDARLQDDKFPWKRHVNTAISISKIKRAINSAIEQWSLSFIDDMKMAGIDVKQDPATLPSTKKAQRKDPSAGVEGTFVCDTCQHVEPTFKLLRIHKFWAHGCRDIVRRYLPATHCKWCHREYHTRSRVMGHLKYMTDTCMAGLLEHFEPIEEEQARQLDKAEAERLKICKRRGIRDVVDRLPVTTILRGPSRKTWCKLGASKRNLAAEDNTSQSSTAVPAQAPSLPPSTNSQEQQQINIVGELNQALVQALRCVVTYHAGNESYSLEGIKSALMCAVTNAQNTVSEQDIVFTLETFVDDFDGLHEIWEDQVYHEVAYEAASALLLHLRPSKMPWLQVDPDAGLYTDTFVFKNSEVNEETEQTPLQDEDIDTEHYAATRAEVTCRNQSLWASLTVLSRTTYVILLPCGGRPRDGDISCQAKWTSAEAHYDLLAISIDVAVSVEWGNLLNHSVIAYWRAEILSGRVAFMICGPPCETWTQLRGFVPVDYDGSYKLPQPLRSRLKPWGLDGLNYGQYKQLQFANSLLMTCLTFFTCLMRSGGSAIIEHPAPPFRQGVASIFWLRQVQWLLKAPSTKLRKFKQSVHGQYAVKPTSLLTLRMGCLGKYLYTRQTEFGTKEFTGTMSGRDTNNHGWFSSAAKEYTPSFCLAMVRAVHDCVQERREPPDTVSDNVTGINFKAYFDHVTVQYDPYMASTYNMGADYAMHNRT